MFYVFSRRKSQRTSLYIICFACIGIKRLTTAIVKFEEIIVKSLTLIYSQCLIFEESKKCIFLYKWSYILFLRCIFIYMMIDIYYYSICLYLHQSINRFIDTYTLLHYVYAQKLLSFHKHYVHKPILIKKIPQSTNLSNIKVWWNKTLYF